MPIDPMDSGRDRGPDERTIGSPELGEREEPTDGRVAREERAAAAEAASIGGDAGEETDDPADRPVVEGGGGESEGFELAEEQLQEHAEHGEDFRRPGRDAFTPEEESDRSSAAYGDPDRIDPPEPDLVGRDDV